MLLILLYVSLNVTQIEIVMLLPIIIAGRFDSLTKTVGMHVVSTSSVVSEFQKTEKLR